MAIFVRAVSILTESFERMLAIPKKKMDFENTIFDPDASGKEMVTCLPWGQLNEVNYSTHLIEPPCP